MAKKINTRIKLKYDTFENWSSNNPVLLAGEVAVVVVPTGQNDNLQTTKPAILFKVGDSTKQFNALPWSSGLSADVYAWAKAPTKPTYTYNEVGAAPTSHTHVHTDITDFDESVKSLINSTAKDTNTTYKIVANGTNSFKLQSKDIDGTWTDVADSEFTVDFSAINAAISGKQDTLVSGTNIKTINGQSVLGSGDIEIGSTSTNSSIYTVEITDSMISDLNESMESKGGKITFTLTLLAYIVEEMRTKPQIMLDGSTLTNSILVGAFTKYVNKKVLNSQSIDSSNTLFFNDFKIQGAEIPELSVNVNISIYLIQTSSTTFSFTLTLSYVNDISAANKICLGSIEELTEDGTTLELSDAVLNNLSSSPTSDAYIEMVDSSQKVTGYIPLRNDTAFGNIIWYFSGTFSLADVVRDLNVMVNSSSKTATITVTTPGTEVDLGYLELGEGNIALNSTSSIKKLLEDDLYKCNIIISRPSGKQGWSKKCISHNYTIVTDNMNNKTLTVFFHSVDVNNKEENYILTVTINDNITDNSLPYKLEIETTFATNTEIEALFS